MGKPLIAFLGLSNSPKWFKLNNNNNNIFSGTNHNNNNTNKFYCGAFYSRPPVFAGVNQSNIMGRRYFSYTLPRKQNSEELREFIIEKNLNPVFIYENLSDSTVKSRVLKDTKDLSGIYLILNKVTLDYYVGSASTGRFHARFSNHLFNFNGSKVVKNAVKKYGLSSFAFMVLELFPEIVTKENNKNLLDLEDFYLKSLLPNYNILTEAGSSFGYKHTETTRLNMKANYSEERRMAIGNLNKGKTFSPTTIQLMKESALNRIKPIFSEEGIKNMKKNSKAILVYNMDYTVYGEFPSITEASKSLGCSQKTITRALQTPKKILKRRWILSSSSRAYSTSSSLIHNSLSNMCEGAAPQFITGFSDGEGCFHLAFSKNEKYSSNWSIWLVFRIGLHLKDKAILENIKSFFNVGNIHKGKTNVSYTVTSISDLDLIINYFDNYPLITKKFSDYILFKQAFEFIKNKEHLNLEGVKSLVNIKASMNRSVPDNLKESFTSIVPAPRVEVLPPKFIAPEWIAGGLRTAAEGNS